jgi:hypothetical protein
MNDKSFCDVPIYKESEEAHSAAFHKYISEGLYNTKEKIKYYEENPAVKQRAECVYMSQFGLWKYNQIVGYLRLYFDGDQILGEYYSHSGRNIHRSTKRKIEYKAHKLAYELSLESGMNSGSIFDRIMEYIALCKKELPKRYFDTSQLEIIGPYVNWRELWLSSS